MFGGKRGVALWLSWVLMVAFLVSISVFMFSWTNNYTKSQVGRLQEISDTSECQFLGISIDSSCQDNSILEVNVTNRNNYEIDQLVFNVYDIHFLSIQTKVLNVSIKPGKTGHFELIKQGTTRQFEVTPVFFTDENIIHCNEKTARMTNIRFC